MFFNDLIGIRFVERLDDGAIIELPVQESHLNRDLRVHGGVIAALVDVALGQAITAHRPKARITTTEMKVNFLRPVREGVMRARARFSKNGRTLVVGSVQVYGSDGKLVAEGLLTYIVLSEE